jgi:shikimate dehydrogenase
MHRAAFAALGVDAGYLALRVRDFAAAWSVLERLRIRGGNVTVPWKEAALRGLDCANPRALLARSANTFWRTADGRLAGTETDGEGFLRAVRDDFGLEPAGLRVAVLGAGGAARTLLHALAQAGVGALYVWNRTPRRARLLVDELRERACGCDVILLGGAADGSGSSLPQGHSIDLLVNATPLGLRSDDPMPADPRGFPGTRFAMDLVYGRTASPFLRAFEAEGAAIADGRSMLLHQGALSFESWLGIPAPVGVMREALGRALS